MTFTLPRRTPALARLLLACFALALGVASAAPLVRALPLEQLCSAAGEVRWVAAGGNEALPGGQEHGLECVLCLPPMLGGPALPMAALPHAAPGYAAVAVPRTSHVPALSRAPFPPRAPPC
ncbi:DUF2946 family protein [Melaminivora sp.]|uniref:DUF2946 family protein n=1 Tax=Melaminivora sp. TaxID=1933032 RepID=UPI0028ADD487|nr:DUF2946 family protein [Melaminivora sp.]